MATARDELGRVTWKRGNKSQHEMALFDQTIVYGPSLFREEDMHSWQFFTRKRAHSIKEFGAKVLVKMSRWFLQRIINKSPTL